MDKLPDSETLLYGTSNVWKSPQQVQVIQQSVAESFG